MISRYLSALLIALRSVRRNKLRAGLTIIGITIGGSGSGLHITGFAIPINTALAVAIQIADGNS